VYTRPSFVIDWRDLLGLRPPAEVAKLSASLDCGCGKRKKAEIRARLSHEFERLIG
jgi:hypothetical protein